MRRSTKISQSSSSWEETSSPSAPTPAGSLLAETMVPLPTGFALFALIHTAMDPASTLQVRHGRECPGVCNQPSMLYNAEAPFNGWIRDKIHFLFGTLWNGSDCGYLGRYSPTKMLMISTQAVVSLGNCRRSWRQTTKEWDSMATNAISGHLRISS